MHSYKESMRKSGVLAGTHPIMAIGSALLVMAFVVFTVIDPKDAGSVYGGAKQFITSKFSWYYIALMSCTLFFSIWIIFSRYGDIRLGQEDEKPEFSNFAWFSMLFGAGIGIGILFWSIAEPILHFQNSPFLPKAQAESVEAAQVAMRITIFHWGLHGWGLFAVMGLVLAYFSYRKGLPLSLRSSLYPILGDRIYGPLGHTVDLLAVFGTLFGIATSLGMGAQQINAGLQYLVGFEVSTPHQVLIIAIISAIATVSVISGVNKGIRILSVLNMRLTCVILALFLIFGHPAYLLGAFITNLGDYFAHAFQLGLWVDPNPKSHWQGEWTMFYWGWWIAWSPFVGMFIARISRGRTIREFMLGVLIAPTLLSALWITVFGNTAMYMQLYGNGGMVAAVNNDVTMALFKTIEMMGLVPPLTVLLATICTVLLVTYFVTSADSATLVICTLVAMGEHPPRRLRAFWGMAIGAVAAVLLLAGGLEALQTASIVAALPCSAVVILAIYGLCKALREDVRSGDKALRAPTDPSIEVRPANSKSVKTPRTQP